MNVCTNICFFFWQIKQGFCPQERLLTRVQHFLLGLANHSLTVLGQKCRTFSRNGEWVCRCRQNFQSKLFQQASGDHYTESYKIKHWNLRKPTGFENFFHISSVYTVCLRQVWTTLFHHLKRLRVPALNVSGIEDEDNL